MKIFKPTRIKILFTILFFLSCILFLPLLATRSCGSTLMGMGVRAQPYHCWDNAPITLGFFVFYYSIIIMTIFPNSNNLGEAIANMHHALEPASMSSFMLLLFSYASLSYLLSCLLFYSTDSWRKKIKKNR